MISGTIMYYKSFCWDKTYHFCVESRRNTETRMMSNMEPKYTPIEDYAQSANTLFHFDSKN